MSGGIRTRDVQLQFLQVFLDLYGTTIQIKINKIASGVPRDMVRRLHEDIFYFRNNTGFPRRP